MRVSATNTESVREMLIRTEKGNIRQTLENCEIVLNNDELLKDAFKLNLMTMRIDIVKDMGWSRLKVQMTDLDVKYLRLYLEKNYNLRNADDILTALSVVASDNRYHPIQDYLNDLVWDGKERLREVLYHFLGVEKSDYSYECLKVWMLGAISRVFNPGTKFEYMLCLVGGQGVGKSTFFRFLAIKDEWFSDDLKRIEDENVFRKMQGHFIIELSEMIATVNARSIEDIKSFISRQSDTYKVPYDRFPEDRPRQCVFGGTSNAMDMLPLDRTGNRRFLPLLANEELAERHILEDEDYSREYFNQLWAEVMVIYNKGDFKLVLDKDIVDKLTEFQVEFMPEDVNAGMIYSFLETYKGDYVCSKLLWHEGLGRELPPKNYELKEICNIMNNSIDGWIKSDKLHNFLHYGRQRAWERDRRTEKPDKEGTDPLDGFRDVYIQEEIPFDD